MQMTNSEPLTQNQRKFLDREILQIVEWINKRDFQLPPRILVIGAGGFMGQWLFAALRAIAKDFPKISVLCKTNHYDLLKSNWFPTSNQNYLDISKESQFDLVFDLSLPETGDSIAAQLRQSNRFFQNLSFATKKMVSGGRLIHPSSGAVYGNLRFSDVLCENIALTPGDCSIYGETKKSIENLHSAFKANRFDLITPRVFSVFGPLMRVNSPLIGNTFIRAAAQGLPIKAFQGYNVYRDFTYITDLVKQFILIGVYGSSVKNINLGTNNIAEIREFGHIISEVSKVNFSAGDTSDLCDRYYGCLHNLHQLEELRYGEVVPLTEAILKSIHFYREN
jgi:nucleoside-diphosphate-sugar epimerase